MKIIQEFKTFAMKGNVIDMAVWVVIGTAFWKIVTSLVTDVITPAVWVMVGGVDFTKWWYKMPTISGGEVMIAYGKFLQTMFDFIIIAFSIFLIIKMVTKASEKVTKKEKKEENKEKKPQEVVLLEEIRDILKIQK